jgi:iron complex outermembrane receptor protein
LGIRQPQDLSASRAHEVQHLLSEEVTVASRDPRLTWIAGLFLFGEADRQPTSIVAPASRIESRVDPRVDAEASAVFGQATFALAPRVAVTTGLRYTHERKRIDNAGGVYSIDSPATLLSGSYSYSDAISHDAWMPKFGLEMRARENVMAYASATRGFKSGGFNASSPAAGRGFAPEWAWSYEGGLKTVAGGGRARLNVAAFHTNYTDLQVQTAIRPGVLDISNAAAATIQGVELEATTLVRDTAHAAGHVAWLDATYDQYLATGLGGVTGDVAGRRLNNSPEWSFQQDGEPLGSGIISYGTSFSCRSLSLATSRIGRAGSCISISLNFE